jgi:ribose transport system permease protein
MNAGAASLGRRGRNPVEAISSVVRDNTWTLGLLVFLAVLLVFTRFVNPNYDLRSLASTATSVLVLALAAVAQAVVVISGGIDLSVSAQMALTSCVAATLMKANPGEPASFLIVLAVLLLGLLLGAINGGLVVLTKVPDIIVTLATSFVWAGFALLVRPAPGGSAAQWLKDLVVGPVVKGAVGLDAVPKAAVVSSWR